MTSWLVKLFSERALASDPTVHAINQQPTHVFACPLVASVLTRAGFKEHYQLMYCDTKVAAAQAISQRCLALALSSSCPGTKLSEHALETSRERVELRLGEGEFKLSSCHLHSTVTVTAHCQPRLGVPAPLALARAATGRTPRTCASFLLSTSSRRKLQRRRHGPRGQPEDHPACSASESNWPRDPPASRGTC
eukprot:2167758-Rhodomonas_salina.2